MSSDPDFDIDALLRTTAKTKELIHSLSQQFLEHKVNYETDFTTECKDGLTDAMSKVLTAENQNRILQEVSNNLSHMAYEAVQKCSADQDLETIINSIDLNGKFEALFRETIENRRFDLTQSEDYNKLLEFVSDSTQSGDSEDIEMVDTDFVIPMDPISKLEITEPVRNKKCNHLYEKSQFLQLIQTSHHGYIKCPVTGCANRQVYAHDVKDDQRMKIFIDRAKQQE